MLQKMWQKKYEKNFFIIFNFCVNEFFIFFNAQSGE